MLKLIEHPESNIEEAIACMGEIIEKKKKELLEHALIDGLSDIPKPCRHLHLSCLKVFQMFFNSSNRFDCNTTLLHDINKAIYLPISGRNSKTLKVLSLHSRPKKKCTTPIPYFNICYFKDYSGRRLTAHKVSQIALRNGFGLKGIPQKGIFCFP